MKLFDSHCHLDFDVFAGREDAVLKRAAERGVRALLVPGVHSFRGSKPEPRPLTASRAPPAAVAVYRAVGIHPGYIGSLGRASLDRALVGLADEARRTGAAAIGECGFDKPSAERGGAPLEEQRRIFEAVLDVANALALPVILHVVGAHAAALDVLRRKPPIARSVVHGYSGSAELVREYAGLGCYFGIGGRISYPGARRLKAAIAAMPRGRLVLETDAPDQALFGAVRGQNEPALLVDIARGLADELALSPEEVAELTWENTCRLYGISGA